MGNFTAVDEDQVSYQMDYAVTAIRL